MNWSLLFQMSTKKRNPKITASDEQKIMLMRYIGPRYWKIFGRLKPGRLDQNTKDNARDKFVSFAHNKVDYPVDKKTLFKNVSAWKSKAIENFNYVVRPGTGGGPRRFDNLSKCDEIIVEVLGKNRALGMGGERVQFFF